MISTITGESGRHGTSPRRMSWPDGKAFAFTIFDDPDLQTVENVSPVYSFLCDLGFRTTKAVWPLRGSQIPRVGGATCEDMDYLRWVLALKEQGFEIALHNVTYHTSPRSMTAHGFDRFHELFGHDPYSLANHTGCAESMYWGSARLSGFPKLAYDALHLMKGRNQFQGHVPGSPLFWGDICRQRVKYVRNFSFGDVNTLKVCPMMPYHDPERPYVNYWFAASEGAKVESFNAMLCEEHQDKLVAEGGACIMYTHLACGFAEGGRLNRRFSNLMTRLSKMNGWFVPVRTLLDCLLESRGPYALTSGERARLEVQWLYQKLFHTRGRS